MKVELIVIMLGIIIVTSISSLVLSCIKAGKELKHTMLVDSADGSVGAGNFSYWQAKHNGPLWLKLTSLKGDADLYVSDTLRPGYEIDANNFSSATCGQEAIYIPYYFPRPIGIGIFGHWSHAVSEFTLQVFVDTSPRMVEEWLIYFEKHKGEKGISPPGRDLLISTTKKEEPQSRFFNMSMVLDVIFDMFVL